MALHARFFLKIEAQRHFTAISLPVLQNSKLTIHKLLTGSWSKSDAVNSMENATTPRDFRTWPGPKMAFYFDFPGYFSGRGKHGFWAFLAKSEKKGQKPFRGSHGRNQSFEKMGGFVGRGKFRYRQDVIS